MPQLRITINHNNMAPSGGMEDAAPIPEVIIETVINETSLEDFEEAHEHFNDARDTHDTVNESDGSYDDRGHGQDMNF
jgi:hypothetical protein